MSSIFDDVPEEWVEKPLGETAMILSGSTPPSETGAYWDGDVVWVTPSDLSTLGTPWIESSERMLTQAGRTRASLSTVPVGGVVISSRAPIGHIGLAATELTLNQGCKALVYGDEHDPRFHYYNLLFRMNRIRARGKGTTFAEISGGELAKVGMPYPTMKGEQVEIAETLTGIDELIDRARDVLAKLFRLRSGVSRSLLACGVKEDGRVRDPELDAFTPTRLGSLPAEWMVRHVSECGGVQLGRQRAPKYQTGKNPVPYLRVANVFDGWIDYSDVLEMDFSKSERANYGLRLGDILLNEGQSIELVGRSAIYRGEPGAYCFQNTLVRFRAAPGEQPDYYRAVFKQWLDTGRFRGVARQTTSIAHLGADRFAQMLIPVPPQAEQKRIAQVLRSQQLQYERKAAHLDKLLRLKSGLMQSLLTGRVRVSDPAPT